MRSQPRDPVGWRRRRPERPGGEIADIPVTLELRPGPPLAFIIDRDSLTEERFGLERRVGLRRAPERRARRDDPHPLPLRVAWRVDETAQMLCREVVAGGGQAAVERRDQHKSSLAGSGECNLNPATRTGTPLLHRQTP